MRILKGLLIGLLIFFMQAVFALPFSIVPKAGTTLPTFMVSGQPVTAYYTVSNNTAGTRVNNYVKHLPPNVTQVTEGGTYGDTCGTLFTLNSKGSVGDSCTLQLTISGPVSADDPNQADHLFVCMPGGLSCGGTYQSLNVTVAYGVLVSIVVTPTNPTVPQNTTQQFTATGHYSDGSDHDITLLVTWASSNTITATITSTGLATALVARGVSEISATLDGIVGQTTLTTTVGVSQSIAGINGSSMIFATGSSNTRQLPNIQFTALSCGMAIRSSSVCVMVGARNGASALAIYVSTNGGRTWALPSSMPSLIGSLHAVYCFERAPTTCVAVGSVNSRAPLILVSTNNGSTWTQPSLTSLPTSVAELNSITCTGTGINTICAAIGQNGLNEPGYVVVSSGGVSRWKSVFP